MTLSIPDPQTFAWFPSIPSRNFDWSAYDPNLYSPCSDPTCQCRSHASNSVGYGATEQEALADFWTTWCDRQDDEDGLQQILASAYAVLMVSTRGAL
jgi:hypothetical protein